MKATGRWPLAVVSKVDLAPFDITEGRRGAYTRLRARPFGIFAEGLFCPPEYQNGGARKKTMEYMRPILYAYLSVFSAGKLYG